MRIQLRQPYLSIASLQTDDLPDFATLIGRNGAGKSQLLVALKEGRAIIPGISVDRIELYDMTSFRSPNTGSANRNANRFARLTADEYLRSSQGDQPPIETAAMIFNECASEIEQDSGPQARNDFEKTLRDEARKLPDFSVFRGNDRSSPYNQALHARVIEPLILQDTQRRNRRSQNQNTNSFNGNQAALISTAMKLAGKLAHELTQDDIMSAFHYEGNTLHNSVSAVFAAYKVDQYTWAHKRIETARFDFKDLIAEYQTKYPPPWDTLREIMAAMREASGDDGLFDFTFSDPSAYELSMDNYESFTFSAQMTNRTTGAQYELDSLSSGEKVLMALCLATFNQDLGRRVPMLLLLDELDAVLHPSMVAALVETLKTLFVPSGTKVLMASHSAMTVAALDEGDIFEVVRTAGHVRVSRTTKTAAINELSEGLATVDVGLRIAACDSAKVTILTEGLNTKHLKKWVHLHFPQEVHVLEDLEQHSNDKQLLAYGRLLAKMNTNTHFVIVWDCDAASKAETLHRELPTESKITPYAFKTRRDNAIAVKGIENNYNESILLRYTTETTRHDGTVIGRGFENRRKAEFADHVLEYGTAQYFSNYQDLHDIISGILESANSSSQ